MPIRYHRHVAGVFSQLHAGRTIRMRRQIDDLRIVVFSDHHRGDLSGADDFLPCRATYHAALEELLDDGFELVLLGDVEELWEAEPRQVVENYGETLALEREFARRGRLWRVFGNHDDAWSHPDLVRRHLGDYLADDSGSFGVFEALSIDVMEGSQPRGEIFLTHGHQGTLDSDILAGLSRVAVRWLWRPLQRLFGIGYSTPSNDFRLRLRHELAMHAWAARQPGLLLVTGHTHHPVFGSQSHESQLAGEVETLEHRLRRVADGLREAIAGDLERKRRQLAHLLAQSAGRMIRWPDDVVPSYFNSGCCSFADGDVTAIEIAAGRIRLVKWTARNGAGIERTSLRSLPLRDVLARCAEAPAGAAR